jgi:ankyrin repeat protein
MHDETSVALFRQLDAAFKMGDLAALRQLCGDLDSFPNLRAPQDAINCSLLQYAIYHSPIAFVRQLLELGADPNYDDGDGFPSLIATLTASRPPQEIWELLTLLLDFGADPNQHGHNDYTPLHWVAQEGNGDLVAFFLAHGALAWVRTRIDDYETPAEVAARAGHETLAVLLRRAAAG